MHGISGKGTVACMPMWEGKCNMHGIVGTVVRHLNCGKGKVAHMILWERQFGRCGIVERDVQLAYVDLFVEKSCALSRILD